MLDSAKDILLKYASGKRAAVAVSGGRDSMCLLHLMLSLPFIDRNDLTVVNVEHGIRGETSFADSAFVENYCRQRGIAFVCERVDVPAMRARSGRSEEQEARQARREIFGRILRENKADLVLLAHHRGDNAETVLMHILRGSALGGLRGMDVRTDSGILRPLLYTPRAEIDEYIALNAVPYVEDATNAETDYNRNFIRHEILPRLEKRYDAENSLTSLAAAARRDDDFISSFLDPDALVTMPLGGVGIAVGKLRKEPALSSRYAVKMLRRFTEDYSLDGVSALLKCALSASGARLDIGGGLAAANEYGYVTLFKKTEPFLKSYPLSIGSFDFGGFTATVRELESYDLNAAKAHDGRLYVDRDKLPQGTTLGTRRQGDRIEPFGGGGRKLKEFLIDKKIPSRLRDALPLLRCEKQVLAVFGVEIARSAAVDSSSVHVLELTVAEGGRPWKG